MLVFWLADLGLIVRAILSAARCPLRNVLGGYSGGRSNAIEALKERYAHGHIGREEYEMRRKKLDYGGVRLISQDTADVRLQPN